VEVDIILVVTRFAVDDGDSGFVERAQTALETLAARPGYLRGRLGRALDEPGLWLLITEWGSVGDYRRALSSFEVKLNATPLLAQALDEASAYEVLTAAAPGGELAVRPSDLAIGPSARPEPDQPPGRALASPS